MHLLLPFLHKCVIWVYELSIRKKVALFSQKVFSGQIYWLYLLITIGNRHYESKSQISRRFSSQFSDRSWLNERFRSGIHSLR
jgi:hypothetical protein